MKKNQNHRRNFWLNVEMGDGCWNWAGTKNENGYGIFRIAGKSIRAHRYSYEAFKGKAGDLFVCHKCDNPACVKPDHLFLGTAKDNSHDMMSKGRNMHVVCPETLARGDRHMARKHPELVRKGEKIPWHILRAKEVSEIRQRYWDGEFAESLADEYYVYISTIRKAVYGFTWKSVPMSLNAPQNVKDRHAKPYHKMKEDSSYK